MFHDIAPIFAMLIPIVAIIGGITAGIVRTVSRQKTIELAQRERIAAIERGIDPTKLPPIPSIDTVDVFGTPEQRAQRRSQGLMIAGIILMSIAFGIFFIARVTEPHDNHWAVSILPGCVGMALLLCAWIVRPRST
ncbi:MAG: DUF6249 domain-containing protein [bacterium]